MKFSFEDGKYQVCFDEKTGRLLIYRYGSLWREETGDKLILAMLQRIEQLEDSLCIHRPLGVMKNEI